VGPAFRAAIVWSVLLAAVLGCRGRTGRKESAPKADAAPSTAKAVSVSDDDRTRALRRRLVETIAGRVAVPPKVLDAIGATPRHVFVPTTPIEEAYVDRPLPTSEGQSTSQPSVIATMTAALELRGGERVLEIGTGSGYQTAILARLAREVFTIEILGALAEEARARLAALEIANVRIRVGDGSRGWPEEAPFDRILVTAAVDDVPSALLDQLREGGILVAPIGPSGPAPVHRLIRIRKDATTIAQEDLGIVRFSPLVRVE
jgi:protein-L-isoaspartate(D-aspartate) O-methyltransferase